MAVEATEENLRHYYIDLNTRLMDMPEIFGMSMGGLRKKLKSLGIEKTQKQAGTNGSITHRINGSSHFHKIHQDKELMERARAKGVKNRRANRLEALKAEGASYEEVFDFYITQNNSLLKTAKYFGDRPKGTMRKLLKFYNITKSPELVKDCREAGFSELYADSERVAEMVAKTRETSLERYGNNWYHNTSSKEEDSVRDAIQERFPELEIIQGSYGIIRRPGRGGLLQLDLYFPEIRFAVEYNGINWHTKDLYLDDLENGTMNSREALKDHLCKIEDIPLVHVWSDDYKKDPDGILAKVFGMIEDRLSCSAHPLAS